ncbi:hypothetical protein Trydic_g784 [Trypoxylus dichotomus]
MSGTLHPLLIGRGKLDPSHKIRIYKTVLRPIVTYASAVWATVATTYMNKLQAFQPDAANGPRRFLPQIRTEPLSQKLSTAENSFSEVLPTPDLVKSKNTSSHKALNYKAIEVKRDVFRADQSPEFCDNSSQPSFVFLFVSSCRLGGSHIQPGHLVILVIGLYRYLSENNKPNSSCNSIRMLLKTSPYNAHSNLNDWSEDMANICVDVDDLHTAAPLLSDDVWKKFELDVVMGTEDNFCDDLFFANNINNAATTLLPSQKCKIRNHDCMWAGHCGSKEHPADEPRLHIRTILPVPPVINRAPMAINKQAVTSGRSLLLKTAIKQQQAQQQTQQAVQQLPQQQQQQQPVVSPDSPPMSDDEECKTPTLQILQDVISSCDIEDDSDLCEYFEEEDFLSESVDETHQQTAMPTSVQIKAIHQYARDNDHSYHKDKNASMHLNNLGIETPSDSEEEIDVVSVGDKHNVRGIASTLPNNPTSIDRQQLQKTMATAISNKRMNSTGIKTALPFRKPCIEQSPVKRRAPEGGRGTSKRIRHQHKLTPHNSPYKRRGTSYNHSSDSEAEPSEKRSLHNNMERQRRIDLRNAFEDLRLLVPEVSKKERAAKVVILREAAGYCDALGDVSDKMCRQKDDLKREQERLRARLSQLRRALAMKHR